MVITISFVIPCYCSNHTLKQVVSEIEEVMQRSEIYKVYEIILVDSSSYDDTFKTIRELCMEKKHVKGIQLTKNFGQHASIMAGFRYSVGDYVVCLDGNGQSPVNEVVKLFAKLEEGYDVVYARCEQNNYSNLGNICSRFGDFIIGVMQEKPKEIYLSNYFAAKRFIINDMVRYTSAYPYIATLILRTTRNIVNVEVQYRELREGAIRYNMKKHLMLCLNGLVSTIKPLKLATTVGIFFSCSGFIYGVYIIVKRIFNPLVPVGFSSIISVIVFMGGLIMIVLGLLGEYIGRIYICLNNYPQYVVCEQMNFDVATNEDSNSS